MTRLRALFYIAETAAQASPLAHTGYKKNGAANAPPTWGHDETSEAIVEAIVGMCDILGLKVLARGVTTAAQRAFLSALGCDLQQGPLFGTTLPAELFRQLLLRDAGQELQ